MPAHRVGTGWLGRRRQEQRLKRERTGDSPEKLAEHANAPGATALSFESSYERALAAETRYAEQILWGAPRSGRLAPSRDGH